MFFLPLNMNISTLDYKFTIVNFSQKKMIDGI